MHYIAHLLAATQDKPLSGSGVFGNQGSGWPPEGIENIYGGLVNTGPLSGSGTTVPLSVPLCTRLCVTASKKVHWPGRLNPAPGRFGLDLLFRIQLPVDSDSAHVCNR